MPPVDVNIVDAAVVVNMLKPGKCKTLSMQEMFSLLVLSIKRSTKKGSIWCRIGILIQA